MNIIRNRIAGALAALAAACALGAAARAQGPDGPGNDPGPGRPPMPPPLPPVIQALDTNHDGIIEPDEIANAAASLRTLLKSGSASLSIPDLLGPPPPCWGRHRHRPGGTGATSGSGAGMDGTFDAAPGAGTGGPGPGWPPPPPPWDGQGPDGPPPPPPFPPPIIQALDTNHDGTIEADEITNSSATLRTLLKSGSTSLSIPDLLGPPPPWPPPPRDDEMMNAVAPPALSGSCAPSPSPAAGPQQ